MYATLFKSRIIVPSFPKTKRWRPSKWQHWRSPYAFGIKFCIFPLQVILNTIYNTNYYVFSNITFVISIVSHYFWHIAVYSMCTWRRESKSQRRESSCAHWKLKCIWNFHVHLEMHGGKCAWNSNFHVHLEMLMEFAHGKCTWNFHLHLEMPFQNLKWHFKMVVL